MKILIIGGDKRSLYMIEHFKDNDLDVVGFDNNKLNKDIKDINISIYDIIIFPIDGIHNDYSITAKYSKEKIFLPKDFLKNTKLSTYIFSGINSEILNNMCINNKYIKLMEYEDVKKENGHLTSEGIIADIINNTNYSLKGANVVVLGYGRIGKPLVNMLLAMKSNVSIGIKSKKENEMLENSFLTTLCMKSYLSSADIIINTVPEIIMDKKNLDYVNPSAYIIDVSSFPYGIDFTYAEKKELNVKMLPGIPGIISPKSAAKILSKKITNTIKEN